MILIEIHEKTLRVSRANSHQPKRGNSADREEG
jgi:hypothetical protein